MLTNLTIYECAGIARIASDSPGELLRQEYECTQPGLVCAAELGYNA